VGTRANRLALSLNHRANSAEFAYDIDDRWSGVIRASYPFLLDATDVALLPAIGVGMALFIGQLCLAREIHLDFNASDEMVQSILPLAEMLYDVRCWKDGVDLGPPPQFIIPIHVQARPTWVSGQTGRSCLLWSGGKDSTLSGIILRENGYDVRPLHITANGQVAAEELRSVAELAQYLGLQYSILQFEFPQYLDLSSTYASNWNEFPAHNTVAFGRDMMLALLATLFMRHDGASCLSMGHDYECKTAYVKYQGKVVPRNDVESVKGALALEAYIQRFLLPTARLLPPIAGLSEFRVLHELLINSPGVIARTSFCFWGGKCGRCAKCLRYYLAQRVLYREDIIHYAVPPLAGDNSPDLAEYIDKWRDETALFRKQVLYCLGRLVERNDIRPDETPLFRFRDEVYPHVAADLDAMERELMRVYTDPQLPYGFRAP
jgi:7-cyano-7-deazaguanine synthase in queuosine biosynthesis